MSDDLKNIVASNVNEEAVVLFGSTTQELIWICTLTCLIVIPVFLLMGAIYDRFSVFIVLSLFFVFVFVFIISKIMQVIKRGKPDGYFVHKMELMKMKLGLNYLGFKRAPFVIADGYMSTTRTKQVVLIDRLEKRIEKADNG